MSAHLKICDKCGREDIRGFTKIGHTFVLRGRTRLAQRLNINSGPAIWKCAPGQGCNKISGTPVPLTVEGKCVVHGTVPS